jgi:hypothetical protein
MRGNFSESRRVTNNCVSANREFDFPRDYFFSVGNVIFNSLEETSGNGIDGVGTVSVVSALVKFIAL